MGKEFVIDNMEDMCALMCDNVVPNKSEYLAARDAEKAKSALRKIEDIKDVLQVKALASNVKVTMIEDILRE